MSRRIAAALLAGGLLLGTAVTTAPAQEAGTYSVPSDSLTTPDPLGLLEQGAAGFAPRDEFVYPLGDRRNPFRSPAERGQGGPSFDALSLSGIIYAPETGSVAVVVDRASGRRYRLRVGDRVGSARLVAVERDRAVFQVTAYGTSRRAVLQIRDSRERELQ